MTKPQRGIGEMFAGREWNRRGTGTESELLGVVTKSGWRHRDKKRSFDFVSFCKRHNNTSSLRKRACASWSEILETFSLHFSSYEEINLNTTFCTRWGGELNTASTTTDSPNGMFSISLEDIDARTCGIFILSWMGKSEGRGMLNCN